MLPSVRMPQFAVETAFKHADEIGQLVRMESPTITTACRQAGLPLSMAEMCGGLLASVVDDLVQVSRLSRVDFERAKRMERILAASQEPAASALRLAMAASPVNGRACVRHWDVVCDASEVGLLAWRLGMDTDNARRYARKIAKLAD